MSCWWVRCATLKPLKLGYEPRLRGISCYRLAYARCHEYAVSLAGYGDPAVHGFDFFVGGDPQRLVRLNCKECAITHDPTPQQQAWLTTMVCCSTVSRPCAASVAPRNGTVMQVGKGFMNCWRWMPPLTQAASRVEPAVFMRMARERMKGRMLADHALELVLRSNFVGGGTVSVLMPAIPTL